MKFLRNLATLFVISAALCVTPPAAVEALVPAAAQAPAPTAAATPDPQLAAAGKSLYARHCSHCHGPSMITSSTVAYDLRRFPVEAKERFVESVIFGKNGKMPPWGDKVNLEEIDAIWAYVLTGGK